VCHGDLEDWEWAGRSFFWATYAENAFAARVSAAGIRGTVYDMVIRRAEME